MFLKASERQYFLGEHEIGTSPSFQADYEACVVALAHGLPFTYFQRRDLNQTCPK